MERRLGAFAKNMKRNKTDQFLQDLVVRDDTDKMNIRCVMWKLVETFKLLGEQDLSR